MANPTINTTYTVTGTDGNGCMGQLSFTVTVNSLPSLSVSPGITICSGQTANLSVGGAVSYTWSPATTPATGNLVTVSPENTTPYIVTGIDTNGCKNSDTLTIKVNPLPAVNAGDNVTIVSGQSVKLNASSGGTSYLWNPSYKLNCDTCLSPSASPVVTTSYTLITTDANGCMAASAITITVDSLCGHIYVPTAFSPNADSRNDVLKVYGAAVGCIDPNGYTFQVYDRWGNQVFEAFNPQQTWDGKYKGTELDNGVFVYKLAYSSNETSYVLTGNVSLIK